MSIRRNLAFALTLLIGVAVATYLAASHAEQPNPPENPVLRAATDACAYPFETATWNRDDAPSTVEYVGDSVLAQVAPLLKTIGEQRCHPIDTWGVPGAAPCDFLPGYGAHTTAVHPRTVVFAFVGNATSPCMLKHIGWARPPAHLTPAQISEIGFWYEVDMRALVRANLTNNIHTLIELPMSMNRGTWHGQMTAQLIARYTRIANSYGGVSVADGTRNALTPGGVYRQAETVDGVTTELRHTDGTHLAAPMGTWLWATAALATALTI